MIKAMVDRSENQLSQTITKAGYAAGIGYSQAEDIGKAAVLLCRQGISGCNAALDALWLDAGTGPCQLVHEGQCLTMNADSARVAIEGVAALDWLVTQSPTARLHVKNCDSIWMFIGLMLLAGATFQTAFSLCREDRDEEIFITPEHSLPDELSDILQPPVIIRCVPVQDRGSKVYTASNFQSGRCQITIADWERLVELAFKSYVPASEESRMRGAGAGLLDND